jgi:hypothetical protein
MQDKKLDAAQFRWLEITGGPDATYPIHHDLSILGYDRAAGTLDLLIRFDDRGGHCARHRHISTTSVLVLEGEQHLDELLPDGARVHKVRGAGEHHLTPGDANPHMERGGPDGALVFYSHHAPDGRLYEIVDDQGTVTGVVTIDNLVDLWERS